MIIPTPREIAEKQQDPLNDCFVGVREDVARLRVQGATAAYAAVEKAIASGVSLDELRTMLEAHRDT